MTANHAPNLEADLWRLVGQRQALGEVAAWHLKEAGRLIKSALFLDTIKARWHLDVVETITGLEDAVYAEIQSELVPLDPAKPKA